MKLPHVLASVVLTIVPVAADPWPRHTVDDGSRGADGVRLGDVNRDGLLDIVTGWEEGGRIRVCLQPNDVSARKNRWPTIEVGKVKSPEDAVFADLNQDGWLDVVSCCEGKQQDVFFHFSPGTAEDLTRPKHWKTEQLPGAANASRWMFCEPLSDGRLMIGSKQPNAQISIWDSANADQGLLQLRRSNWIMSLRAFDVDADGLHDIIYSDRKGNTCQVGWLKNPGDDAAKWTDHVIGGKGREVMFLDIDAPDQSNGSRTLQMACNTKDGGVLLMRPTEDVTQAWKMEEVTHSARTGSGKGVAFSDVNSDGRIDLVCTCEHSERKVGVFWLEQPQAGGEWIFHDISGSASGIKFDRIEMLDLDGDGDQDLLTCEERDNLGVIWYENTVASERIE